MVLSQALAETYEQQPNDPVEFFSKFLLHHIDVRGEAQKDCDKVLAVKACKDAFQKELDEVARIEKVRLEHESKVIDRKRSFFDCLEKSDDLNENLQ